MLGSFVGDHGLIRVKPRVANREDTSNFRFPVVLSAKHNIVNLLIWQEHIRSCHVGTQGLLSWLREKFWILGGRQTIRRIITKCMICKRYSAKHLDINLPPLPVDRVRDAIAFEVTSVDFTGSLFFKDGNKVWICLFTCAVYRAIHLELCMSLSTCNFLEALR